VSIIKTDNDPKYVNLPHEWMFYAASRNIELHTRLYFGLSSKVTRRNIVILSAGERHTASLKRICAIAGVYEVTCRGYCLNITYGRLFDIDTIRQAILDVLLEEFDLQVPSTTATTRTPRNITIQ